MKNTMRVKLMAGLVFFVLASALLANVAVGAEPNASQVRDNESLKEFVEGVKAHIEAITDMNEIARLRERVRTEGNWKSGATFLIIFIKSGVPFIHGNDRTAESKNLIDVVDERGTKVVQELFSAAAQGGGFVQYHDGEP